MYLFWNLFQGSLKVVQRRHNWGDFGICVFNHWNQINLFSAGREKIPQDPVSLVLFLTYWMNNENKEFSWYCDDLCRKILLSLSLPSPGRWKDEDQPDTTVSLEPQAISCSRTLELGGCCMSRDVFQTCLFSHFENVHHDWLGEGRQWHLLLDRWRMHLLRDRNKHSNIQVELSSGVKNRLHKFFI